MIRELRVATMVFLLLTIVTGVAYPAFVTLVAQVAFPDPASGSLVRSRRQAGRLAPDRAVVLVAAVFLGPSVGDRPDAEQWCRVRQARTRVR